MGLINVPDIQNLDAATPALWNSRYGTIVDVINGNLSSDNLADSAVTTAKLGALSVTAGKMAAAAITPDKLATGVDTDVVATAEDTASTSYTALATAGPAVTVTIGLNGLALVILYSYIANSTDTASGSMGFTVSGATTVAENDAFALIRRASDANIAGLGAASAVFLVEGLTPGSNTFTARYKVNAGTGRFTQRKITVLPL